MVHVGSVPNLVTLARGGASEDARDAAIHALGAIAVDDPLCRDFVLKTITAQKVFIVYFPKKKKEKKRKRRTNLTFSKY